MFASLNVCVYELSYTCTCKWAALQKICRQATLKLFSERCRQNNSLAPPPWRPYQQGNAGKFLSK